MTSHRAAGHEVACELIDPTPQASGHRLGPIRLTNTDEIRVEMARVYREARRGRIKSEEATRLVYVLSQIVKAYELSVLERRINALEAGNGEPA